MKSNSAPGLAGLIGETRMFGEVTAFVLRGLLRRALPNMRRHRRGVLLIPGFGAGDLTLSPLADRLRELGYRIFFSGILCNVDCPVHMLMWLAKVLRKANRKTPGKIVVIVNGPAGITRRNTPLRFLS